MTTSRAESSLTGRAFLVALRYAHHVQVFGFGRGLLFATRPPRGEVAVTWEESPYPVWVRPGSSDISTFKEVLIENEYAFALLKVPHTIIDVGANIGLASIWFAVHYPEAKIFAVEAERMNFDLLVKNVAVFPNITPMHAALWSHGGMLAIDDPNDDGPWGFQTKEMSSDAAGEYGTVEALGGAELIARSGFGRVDLLKIDIEGAEKEVFSDPGAKQWLDDVNSIAIELHDRFQPGCSRAFFNRVQDFPIELSNGGNTFFVSRTG